MALGDPIDIYVVLLTAFAVPVIMSIVGYFKREGAVDTKAAISDLSVHNLQKDMTEIKTDVKIVIQKVNEMFGFKERIETLEEKMKVLDALDKDLGIIKVRLANIEDKVSTHKTSGSDRRIT